VSGLMPWIVKHKVNSNDEANLEKAVEDDRPASISLRSIANLGASMRRSTKNEDLHQSSTCQASMPTATTDQDLTSDVEVDQSTRDSKLFDAQKY
jgi:hypothetical protein